MHYPSFSQDSAAVGNEERSDADLKFLRKILDTDVGPLPRKRA